MLELNKVHIEEIMGRQRDTREDFLMRNLFVVTSIIGGICLSSVQLASAENAVPSARMVCAASGEHSTTECAKKCAPMALTLIGFAACM
jgi:hypothetical protein